MWMEQFENADNLIYIQHQKNGCEFFLTVTIIKFE